MSVFLKTMVLYIGFTVDTFQAQRQLVWMWALSLHDCIADSGNASCRQVHQQGQVLKCNLSVSCMTS